MIINKTIYTIGNVRSVEDIVAHMREGKSNWEYFVYTAENSKHILNIAPYNEIHSKCPNAIILGIAPSKRLAFKLVTEIVLKALSLGETVESGISKLIV